MLDLSTGLNHNGNDDATNISPHPLVRRKQRSLSSYLAAHFDFDGGGFDPVEILADPVVGDAFDGAIEADETLIGRDAVQTSSLDVAIPDVSPKHAIVSEVVVHGDGVL